MIKIDERFISKISDKAKTSERRRMNYNFHKKDSETLQRMLNALEIDTYIQPHKHENPDKVEVFFVLRGRILVVEFDDNGNITDYIVLNSNKGNYGAEIPAKTWHTIIALEPGTVAYEVKDGPYNPKNDKTFAKWAPDKDTQNSKKYIQKILKKLKV